MGSGRGCANFWTKQETACQKPQTGVSRSEDSLQSVANRCVHISFARAVSREVRFSKNKATRMERASCKHGGPYNDDSPISDSGEDVREASAAPEPDAGITYSYDAAHGPHKGGQILSMALAKAVEKYEIQATEKLVMTEYEVVGEEKDEASTGYAADDSDFELI